MTTDLLFKNGLDFFFSIEQQFLVSRHQTGRCLEKKVFYLNVNHKHFNFKLVFFLWRKKISPTLRSVMPSTTNLMLAENAICVVLWRQQKNAHATSTQSVSKLLTIFSASASSSSWIGCCSAPRSSYAHTTSLLASGAKKKSCWWIIYWSLLLYR